MNEGLVVAGVLALVCGASHSYLGERSFGETAFTRLTLRFTWHFFAVVVWSTAVLFLTLSGGSVEGGNQTAIRIIAGYWGVFAAAALVMSRGRHFAWALGSGIAITAWWGSL